MLHNEPLFQVYFGSKKDQLEPFHYQNIRENKNILTFAPYKKVQRLMGLKHLIFNKQQHGIAGYAIKPKTVGLMQPFIAEGDFLITAMRDVGLGIITADCLPVIIFDPIHNVIGIAHAGWRGSVEQIGPIMLQKMQAQYGTAPETVRVLFGPCAKVCCYEVDKPFLDNLDTFPFIDQILHKQQEKFYFSIPDCNRLQLENLGVKKEAFIEHYNHCTICDNSFCSVRAQKEGASRQMSVVALK